MMKADVTAENRPACSKRRVHTDVVVCGQNAHKYQRGVQIFVVSLDKVVIVVVRRALELIVELDGGVICCPETRKEAWQYFEHSFLHAGNQQEGR